MIGDNELH